MRRGSHIECTSGLASSDVLCRLLTGTLVAMSLRNVAQEPHWANIENCVQALATSHAPHFTAADEIDQMYGMLCAGRGPGDESMAEGDW